MSLNITRRGLLGMFAAGVGAAVLPSGVIMPVKKLILPPTLDIPDPAYMLADLQLQAHATALQTDPAVLPEGVYTTSFFWKRPGDAQWTQEIRVVDHHAARRLHSCQGPIEQARELLAEIDPRVKERLTIIGPRVHPYTEDEQIKRVWRHQVSNALLQKYTGQLPAYQRS